MQSVEFTEYDLASGAILYSTVCHGRVPVVPDGVGRVLGSRDPLRYFVNPDTRRFNLRKPNRVKVSRSGNVIRLLDVPENMQVWLDGVCYCVDDGEFELVLDQPVSVRLRLVHGHYIESEITL